MVKPKGEKRYLLKVRKMNQITKGAIEVIFYNISFNVSLWQTTTHLSEMNYLESAGNEENAAAL